MTNSAQFLSLPPLTAAAFLMSVSAYAADVPVEHHDSGARYEIAFGFNYWSALGDLQPVSNGKFEDVGYSFSGAAHWPLTHVRDRKLLLGIDFGIVNNESNIPFATDVLVIRGAYLVPSFKWRPSNAERLSIDGGLGFYFFDIGEPARVIRWSIESELWGQNALGGFVGGTWEFSSSSSENNNGLMMSFEVHFFDLGTVKDEDPSLPASLSVDAGKLAGPLYQLQLGYRWE